MILKESYVDKETGEVKVRDIEVPDINIDIIKEKQKSLIATARYNAEVSGVNFFDSIIKTDRESQGTLTSAWVRCQQKPDILIDWKSATGWVQLDKTTVESICEVVGNHVQQCFTREKELCNMIDSLNSIEDIKNIIW